MQADLRTLRTRRRTGLFVVLALAVMALAPFLNKAYHLDDTLFLKAAEQIRLDPTHPYAFEINWFEQPTSMWTVTQNPPLAAYVIAGLQAAGLQSERGQHLVFLFFALASIALAWRIAETFCQDALWVSLAVLAAPAFFVTATNLMADTLLLALTLAAIDCWLTGLKRDSWRWFLWSTLFVTLAVLTKYFGVFLLVLLPVLTWVKQKHWSRSIRLLLIPAGVLLIWNLYSFGESGHFHILGAAVYSATAAWRNCLANLAITAAFIGGGFWFPIVLLPLLSRQLPPLRLLRLGLVTASLGGILWWTHFQSATGVEVVLLEWLLMAWAGLLVLAWLADGKWAGLREWCHQCPEDLFLWLWLGLVLVFVVFFNWTVSARALLPGLLPLAILVARKFAAAKPSGALWAGLRWLAPATGLVLSLALARVDACHADASRTIANELDQKFHGTGKRILFAGHWGLQYYMTQKGFAALNYTRLADLTENDLILFPILNNSNANPVPAYRTLVLRQRVPNPLGLVCTSLPAQAGFYSSQWGILPFGFSRDPIETFVLMSATARPRENDTSQPNSGR